jgi:RNA polymerase sigma-70 factor (ECF subfamily)
VLHDHGAADVLQARRQGRLLRRRGPNPMSMPMTARPASTPADGTRADVELWRALNARLVTFVSRRIADRHAAEDVAQEVLLRLYRGLDQLRAGDRLDAFAYRIARNAIIDHYRSTASAKEQPAAPDDLAERIDARAATAVEPEAVAGAQELARCLQPLVRRLPASYREALLLTDLGELSQVQAADIVGLSIPGMKARVQRGRAQLHQLLIRCCDIAREGDRRISSVGRNGPCACAPRSADVGARPSAP